MMFGFDNLDIMIGNENINPLERELANAIGESTVQYDSECNPHSREDFHQGDEFRNSNHENIVPRRDGCLESIETFTNEFNFRLSHEMYSMMSMMHSQNNRARSSAISDRVIPEILNIVS